MTTAPDPDAGPAGAHPAAERAASRRSRSGPRGDPLVLLWLCLPALVWAAHGFHDVLGRDAALYVHAGQAVADGHAPYEAVMNRAGPLSHLLPGLGVALGRLVGVGDVLGARGLYFALAAASPLLVYLATRLTFGSRLGGCVAAAAMLSFQGFARMATVGPDSKIPMVLFLTVALILLMRRQMVLAGVATGLATLTWQPVLFAVAGGAIVVVLTGKGGRRARLTALGGFILGGLATLAVAVGYFAAVDAVGAFVDGFWRANASATDQPGLLHDPGRLWRDLGDWYGWTIWLLLAGCALSIGLAVWARSRNGDEESDALLRQRTLALAVVVLGGLGWSVYAFQGGPDALILLPLASIALGGTVAVAMERSGARGPRRTAAAAVASWVLVATATTTSFLWGDRSQELRDEQAAARAVFAELPADVSIMSAQAPQPLALAGRHSISRYVLFTDGMLTWIDTETPGGLDGFVAGVEAARPAVLFTSGRPQFSRFLRPLRPDYGCVGVRPKWMVWLRTDLDPELRRSVASALAAVGSGGPGHESSGLGDLAGRGRCRTAGAGP